MGWNYPSCLSCHDWKLVLMIEFSLSPSPTRPSPITRVHPQVACLPPLAWDSELAEVAQVWADQCALINYPPNGVGGFPQVFHEKSRQRSTSKFHHPPGVGQNVAWALTQDINFTQIIDDLWYRDIRSLRPGVMDDFRVSPQPGGADAGGNVITQMLWGHTTHIGCGWAQIDVGESRFDYPGRYENFFVCNYGVGGNVPGQPVYQHPDCQSHQGEIKADRKPS